MKSCTTSGMIVQTDRLGIDYCICRLDYTVYEDDTFRYVFTPDYRIIDILTNEFQGIPGIDLSLRKGRYVRENIVPVFVSERTPSEHREDFSELLNEVGMTYLDPVEWMVRSDRRYFGDDLSMAPLPEDDGCIEFESMPVKSSITAKRILSAIGSGRDVVIDGMAVDDGNRGAICNVLRALLRSEIESKRTRKDTRGRKSIPVSDIDVMCAVDWMEKGFKTSDQIAKELGISRATLYRRIREYKSDKKK